MDVAEALRVLGLSHDLYPGGNTTSTEDEKRSVRRAYLRRALEVHPDREARCSERRGDEGDGGRTTEGKNEESKKESKKESFQRLREAYEVALRHVDDGEKQGDDFDDLLMRAFRGEDVRAALARRGGWRPGEEFGVDLDVRWMGGGGAGGDEGGDAWRDELEAGLGDGGDDEDDFD
jgi:hypothetical protein